MLATNYFSSVEQNRLLTTPPSESLKSYMELFEFNLDICNRYLLGSVRAINNYNNREIQNVFSAWLNTILNLEGENLEAFLARHAKMIDSVTNLYPREIKKAEADFGFHFERGRDMKFAETDRFVVYQVFPTDENITVNESIKPILILPPYVLGANILAFLPEANKSYTHSFANMGIPTYIRIEKDILKTPAVQVMTGEDDALDTKFFCEKIKARHKTGYVEWLLPGRVYSRMRCPFRRTGWYCGCPHHLCFSHGWNPKQRLEKLFEKSAWSF
jgi:hypothetical protein